MNRKLLSAAMIMALVAAAAISTAPGASATPPVRHRDLGRVSCSLRATTRYPNQLWVVQLSSYQIGPAEWMLKIVPSRGPVAVTNTSTHQQCRASVSIYR